MLILADDGRNSLTRKLDLWLASEEGVQSCGTEPVTSEVYVNSNSVSEVNVTSQLVLENWLLWGKNHTSDIRSI